MQGPPVHIGDSEAQITSLLGKPAVRYANGAEATLIYPRGPFGQETYVASFGPDGKLRSYEQVLSTQKFGTIKINEDNKQTIMRTFGPPAETSYLSIPKLEVWSYRYRESNVWNSMMHVHFDKAGIVRKLESGPDPRDDDRDIFSGILGGH